MTSLPLHLVSDMLLVMASVTIAAYCFVLSRRLKNLRDLDKGVGGAIAVLSMQVDDMTTTLTAAQKSAVQSSDKLNDLNSRAEDAAKRLELLIASTHDLPSESPKPEYPTPEQAQDEMHQAVEEEIRATQDTIFSSSRAQKAS